MNDRAIFLAALEKADAERAAYLDEACAGDDTLRRQVERLLRAHVPDDSFLEKPVLARGDTVDEQPPAEQPGSTIGPYKLLQQIGEGGMGVVYMAEQQEPVRRMVALKIIKPGMDTNQVIARFESERQALALMDHPNIAKVLDAGETPSAHAGGSPRPYFVMELVKGVPITKFCDEHQLTPRERLELFLPVCQAVQHAHQKGIIHRDLKPSNVLVALYDDRPVPKVIDFGVAKATEQKLTERTLFTQYGTMVGTLEYMSPEQAEMSALGVDTRSDIYSLGVLLYELLTGTTPLSRKRLKEAAYGEILRMIKEEEPQKPSTRLSDSGEALASISAQRHMEPGKLTRLVRGELDWIVMKTLEKDRNRRYETANGFAADVQRYLNDEPVQACPPSALYRFRKFARRNKRVLATAAVLAVAALVVTGTLGWAVRDSDAQAQEAARDRVARQTALELRVTEALEEAALYRQEAKWPEALTAVKRAEALLAGGEINRELKQRLEDLKADQELMAKLEDARMLMAELKDNQFDFERAANAFAKAFREYGIDVEVLSKEDAAERLRAHAIRVELAQGLDNWSIARIQSPRKDAKSWEDLLALARAVDPDPWRDRLRLALGHDRKALLELAKSAEFNKQLPTTQSLLAQGLGGLGAKEQAVALLRQALRQRHDDFWINFNLAWQLEHLQPPQLDEALRFYTAALALRPRSPAVLAHLGDVFADKREVDEAIAEYREAIRLKPDYADAHNNLGSALQRKGLLDESVAALKEAIRLKPDFALAYSNLGMTLWKKGLRDNAIAALKEAIRLKPNLAFAYSNLGIALKEQGLLNEAIAAGKEAIRLKPAYAAAHSNLGNALLDQEKLDEAIVCYRMAIELDPKLATAHMNLGVAYAKKGMLNAALAAHKEAVRLKPDDALAQCNLGDALRHKGLLEEAIAACNVAIRLKPDFAEAHYNLGGALQDKVFLEEAVAAYKEAIRHKPDFAEAYSSLGVALQDEGLLEQAIAACKHAIRLKPGYASAHFNLGSALHDKHLLNEAIAAYKEAIRLRPDFATAHNNLGNALRQKGLLEEAIAAYKEAIRITPDDHTAHNNLGNALRDKGMLNEAVAAYKQAIRLKPDLAAPRVNLGIALAHLGKYFEAEATHEEATRVHPNAAETYNGLAWLLATCPEAKIRAPRRAVELAKKAVQLAPKQGDYWNTLGVAHYRHEDWNAAIEALNKSMEFRKGGDANDWFFLAMAHRQLNQKEPARKWYDQSVGWMEKNAPHDEDLRRYRVEAAVLLGLNEK